MSDESDETTGPDSPPPGLAAGMDLVRRTLDEARSAARKQNKDVGRGRASVVRNQPVRSEPVRKGRRRWSGPGPDSRDPQSLGSVTSKLSRERGWSAKVAEGSVLGLWSSVVGEQIADHAAPIALRDGVLTIEAESTAWATQLRMVQAQVLAKIAASVGDGVVTSLRILGPAGPTWRKGPRHIAGRGPRDTYG